MKFCVQNLATFIEDFVEYYFSALRLCSELHETVQQICRYETPNNLRPEKLYHMGYISQGIHKKGILGEL